MGRVQNCNLHIRSSSHKKLLVIFCIGSTDLVKVAIVLKLNVIAQLPTKNLVERLLHALASGSKMMLTISRVSNFHVWFNKFAKIACCRGLHEPPT